LGELSEILIGKEKHLVSMTFVGSIVGLKVSYAHSVPASEATCHGAVNLGGAFLLAHRARDGTAENLELVVGLHEL
jgi:hypothetical protein